MNEISSTHQEWEETTLGRILSIVRNGFSGQQVNTQTDYPVTRIETISNGFIDMNKVGYVKKAPEDFRMKKGDILLSNINSLKHIGKVAIVDKDIHLYHGMNLLILRFTEEIEPRFLFYLLIFRKNWFEKVATQAINQASINQSTLRELDLRIPKLRDDQRKIADILSKIDDSIDLTEKLVEKYKLIKVGMLQDLLTKGIDESYNIRSEETHEFKDSPLGRIPKEWALSRIGDIYELKAGITPSRTNKSFFNSDDGYNWVKTLDLNEGFLYTTEEKLTQLALDSTSVRIMPINTVLIAMYGGWEQIGRTAILKKEAATNQAVTGLFNPKIEMSSEFVQLILQHFRYKWKQYAVSTRKDPNITKNDIEQFIIIYPKNHQEQVEIANRILSIKKLIDITMLELEKLKQLKTGLMQDLLTGKVRVTDLISKAGELE